MFQRHDPWIEVMDRLNLPLDVLVHAHFHAVNILVQDGLLAAVIDWGVLWRAKID